MHVSWHLQERFSADLKEAQTALANMENRLSQLESGSDKLASRQNRFFALRGNLLASAFDASSIGLLFRRVEGRA